jgi:hypothetical protein
MDGVQIIEDFRRETEPALLERFAKHFAAGEDARRVLDVLCPIGLMIRA